MEEYLRVKLSGLTIVGDVKETDNPYQYGEELTDILNRTYAKVIKRKIRNPQVLHKLISKYDNVPAFRNYLVTFYSLAGKGNKARAVNEQLIKQYPDYLYGKLNHCAFLLHDEQYEKIQEILGEALTLDGLYPERKVFHVAEFSAFERTVVDYLLRTRRLDAAQSHIKRMEEVLGMRDPGVMRLRSQYKEQLAIEHLQQYSEPMKARQGQEEFTGYPLPEQVTSPPAFQHEALWILYKKDVSIEPEVLDLILQLPKASLIADLEKIVLDAAQRKVAIEKDRKNKSWTESPLDFLLHAIALLCELGAKEKMPLILKTLSYEEDFVDYFLGDHLTETLWQFFYRLYEEDVAALQSFLASPDYTWNAKAPLMEALTQIGLRMPERRQEVIEAYAALLDIFIENLQDVRITGTEVITSVVIEAIKLVAQDLLPKIKILLDLDLVDQVFTGDYDDIVLQMQEPPFDRMYNYFPTIPELYAHIRTNWYEEEEEEEGDIDALIESAMQTLREKDGLSESGIRAIPSQEPSMNDLFSSNKKIGRNQPCPCGSGKKYKRCCLNK